MPLPLDWSKDPVVLLEKHIQPVLHLAAEHLAGAFGEPLDIDTTKVFLTAEALLASGGADFLSPADVFLGKAIYRFAYHLCFFGMAKAKGRVCGGHYFSSSKDTIRQ